MDFHNDPYLTIFSRFIIFIISYISNVFSSIAGGGAGLIQLPALILFGIPYYKALAIHKVATVALGIGGSIRNYKNLEKNYFIIFQLIFNIFFDDFLIDDDDHDDGYYDDDDDSSRR